MFSRYALFGGRRVAARRVEEAEGAIVDRHGPLLFALIMAIVGLNLADAWFTLYFLAQGGEELNPFVQWILELGGHPYPFLLFKTVGIGLACCFLALTKNFRSSRLGMSCVFLGYATLLGWHLFLLQRLLSAH